MQDAQLTGQCVESHRPISDVDADHAAVLAPDTGPTTHVADVIAIPLENVVGAHGISHSTHSDIGGRLGGCNGGSDSRRSAWFC